MTEDDFNALHQLFLDMHTVCIVEFLLGSPGACVLEIENHLNDIFQSSVSHHLRKLRAIKLVYMEKHELHHHYYVNLSRLREIVESVNRSFYVKGGS